MKKLIIIFLMLTTLIFAANDTNETTQKTIYTLEIKGLKSLDKDDLAKAIGAKEEGFFSSKFVISEEFVKVIPTAVKNFMQSHGFFDYKMKLKKENKKIILIIDEGRPVRVTDIKIDSDIDIKKFIPFKVGDIFSSEEFLESKDEIIKFLMESGYCQYKLDTKAYVDLKSYSAKLKYFVRKNRVCRFGKIKIAKKPKDIKKEVILSRIKYTPGEVFSTKKIEESYLALNKLNVFANINIMYDLDKNSSVVDTTISLDKREKLKRYEVAIGYDSEIGMRFRGSWEHRNILHNATKLSVSTQYSKRIKSLQTTFFMPAAISHKGHYLDFYSTLGSIKENQKGFNRRSFFLNSYLEYNHKKWDVKAGVGIENLKIDLKEESDSIIGGTFNMIYPYVEAIYDSRDSKLDPTKGIYGKFYWEYGLSSSKEGAVQYFKYLVEGRFIHTIDDLTLSAVAKVGVIKKFSGKLPASKLFYGGGAFSNRAYSKNSVGVVTSSTSYKKLGGKSLFNLQLEANYKLYKNLYGAVFFDSTMIAENSFDFHGKRLDTLGVGLRYKTPIGPVKIDFGFNVRKFKQNAISIMLGQSF